VLRVPSQLFLRKPNGKWVFFWNTLPLFGPPPSAADATLFKPIFLKWIEHFKGGGVLQVVEREKMTHILKRAQDNADSQFFIIKTGNMPIYKVIDLSLVLVSNRSGPPPHLRPVKAFPPTTLPMNHPARCQAICQGEIQYFFLLLRNKIFHFLKKCNTQCI
jgi:hypothetical protein